MFVDIFVLIVILGSVIISFLRGFIREVFTILGIFGGIVAAYIGGPLLIPTMYGWLNIDPNAEEPQKLFDIVPYPMMADALSYGLVLVVFIIIFSMISHFMAEAVKNIGLGALDRTLGVIFGFVRGVLVLGLLYLPFYYLVDEEQKEEWFTGSKTQVYLDLTAGWIDQYIPKEVAEGVGEHAESLKDVSETRKKLEEMDVLNRQEEDGQAEKDGYNQEFRENMQELFEENSDTSPEFNN